MKWAVLSVVLILSIDAFSQSIEKELRFAKYLFDQRYFDEGLLVLKPLLLRSNTSGTKDTINTLIGRGWYNLRQLDSAIVYFERVQTTSPYFAEARLFSGFSDAYLRRYEKASDRLLRFKPRDSTSAVIRNFELCGVSLLQRNLARYDSLAQVIDRKNSLISKQADNFDFFKSRIQKNERKKPLVAGLLSAAIPGAGRMYAGYTGQGIMTLLISGIIASQAIEGYRKDGPQSFRFIAYTSLFATVYVANIWGSTLAVKIRKEEINRTIDEQILFDLHIPLRTAFR